MVIAAELLVRIAFASCGCAWLRLSWRRPFACASLRPFSLLCGACEWLPFSLLRLCASSFGRPSGPPTCASGSFLYLACACGFGSKLELKFRRLARGIRIIARHMGEKSAGVEGAKDQAGELHCVVNGGNNPWGVT